MEMMTFWSSAPPRPILAIAFLDSQWAPVRTVCRFGILKTSAPYLRCRCLNEKCGFYPEYSGRMCDYRVCQINRRMVSLSACYGRGPWKLHIYFQMPVKIDRLFPWQQVSLCYCRIQIEQHQACTLQKKQYSRLWQLLGVMAAHEGALYVLR